MLWVAGIVLAGFAALGGWSAWQAKTIDTLKAENAHCSLLVDSYVAALDEQTAATEKAAAAAKARSKAVQAAIDAGRRRAAELEVRIDVLMRERQPDKDPCVAACMLLRSPL